MAEKKIDGAIAGLAGKAISAGQSKLSRSKTSSKEPGNLLPDVVTRFNKEGYDPRFFKTPEQGKE